MGCWGCHTTFHMQHFKVSVFGVFLCLFSRIWTEYGPEKLRIRTIFTQCLSRKQFNDLKALTLKLITLVALLCG